MFTRFGSWSIVLMMLAALILPALPLLAQEEDTGTPAVAPDQSLTNGEPDQDEDAGRDDDGDQDSDTGDDGEDQDDRVDPCPDNPSDACITPPTDESERDGDVSDPTVVPDQNQTGPPSTVEPEIAVSNLAGPPIQAADASSVVLYCDIRDSNQRDQRIVGTFINVLVGYGDPQVTFTLYDLTNTVITPIPGGSATLPGVDSVVAPVTANAPTAVKYEWGPGPYAKLAVVAVYPSLDPATYGDSRIALELGCVPTPFTPTPGPTATVDPAFTPPPAPTAASYYPVIVTEMKDAAGNTVPDNATVIAGTGIYDIATISGLPPGTIGSVSYAMSKDCGGINLVSGPHSVVADANGVAVAPNSAIFTAPGFPGGAYDWIVIYFDAAVGNVYTGCGPETFNVPPPLPTSGTGNAILTCFLASPPVPGTAGYGVNVDPLPVTGTVQVNVTLQVAGIFNFEHKTLTLPPGMTNQLAYSGPYVYAWVNVVFRDATGAIYAVINLEGACTATPGPFATNTPAPTSTPVMTPPPTDSPTSTATSPPTVTPTLANAPTGTSTLVPTSTSTPTPISTVSPTSPSTGTSTATAPSTPGPTSTPAQTFPSTPPPTPTLPFTPVATFRPTATLPASTSTMTTTPPRAIATVEPVAPTAPSAPLLLTGLPNTGSTGSGVGGSAGLTTMLVAAAMIASLILWIAVRGRYNHPSG